MAQHAHVSPVSEKCGSTVIAITQPARDRYKSPRIFVMIVKYFGGKMTMR
jgi:hypothetical protein